LTFRALNKTKRDLNLAVLSIISSVCIYFLVFCSMAIADETSGETFYKHLSSLTNSGNNSLIEKLNTNPRKLDWNSAKAVKFKGHLRFLTSVKQGSADQTMLFFLLEALKAELSSSPYLIEMILFTKIWKTS